ncbi:DUF3108 domain-containing protein [Bacteroidota bacterium]
MKISTFLSLIVLCCCQLHFSQSGKSLSDTISLDKRLHVGDEFTYLVKYAFLNLGEVKTKVYSKDTINGKSVYKSIAHIDSYDGLPFVNIHQTYETWFDSTFYPLFFRALDFNEQDTSYTKYHFINDNTVHILKGKLNREDTSIDTTVTVLQRCHDGLSLLFYARFMSRLNNLLTIPCFINEDTAVTKIFYEDNEEAISIETLDYEVDCFRIEGIAGFTGVFGLTGDFDGWFSNDEYSVPIYANLQVIIGNIAIELINWERGEWQPPAYE